MRVGLAIGDYTRVWRTMCYGAVRVVPALLVLLGACGRDSLTCTLLPNMTGLTVELSAQPTGPYTVEVVVPSSSPVSYGYRCDGGPSCVGTRIFFPGLVTAYPTIRVTTALGTRATPATREVKYTDSYPNGPSCEPRTTSATVAAAIPE